MNNFLSERDSPMKENNHNEVGKSKSSRIAPNKFKDFMTSEKRSSKSKNFSATLFMNIKESSKSIANNNNENYLPEKKFSSAHHIISPKEHDAETVIPSKYSDDEVDLTMNNTMDKVIDNVETKDSTATESESMEFADLPNLSLLTSDFDFSSEKNVANSNMSPDVNGYVSLDLNDVPP